MSQTIRRPKHSSDRNGLRAKDRRSLAWFKANQRRGFLLLVVLLVVAAVTLGAMAFTQSMFLGHEESLLAGESIQARYAADSGIDAARLFLAHSRLEREEAGGTYSNANTFQAIPVLSGRDPANVCNYTLVAPDLNEDGKYSGVRFGLQNESGRLNLNVLPIIDSQMSLGQMSQMAGGPDLSSMGISAGATSGGASGGMGGSGSGGQEGSSGGGIGRELLMALPSMTEEIADCILDFIDADDEPREFGAERDYYTQLPVPYAPANGPLQSIEQLLLVRGVTPALLFGLDQNRNGVLESSESAAAQSSTLYTDMAANSGNGNASIEDIPSLGWAAYLTLYSKEKNVAQDGSARININGSDLATLQSDLAAAVGEDLATFIIAYRVNGAGAGGAGAGGASSAAGFIPSGGGGNGGGNRGNNGNGPNGNGGGRPGGGGGNGGPPGGGPGGGGGGPGGGGGGPRGGRSEFLPLSPSMSIFGVLQQRGGGPQGGGNRGGSNPGSGNAGGRGGNNGPGGGGGRGGNNGRGNNNGGGGGNGRPGNGTGGAMGGVVVAGGAGGGSGKTQVWKADMFSQLNIDTSQGAGGNVRQVLDLIGASFTADVNGESVTFTSPLDASPLAMASYLPTIMDKLTAVEATILPGRININEAPREILSGLPGMTTEILDALIESRAQSVDNSNRKFETWPMVEGIITLQQMQMIAPLVTGGGDCMRVQSIGYFEQSAGYSRTEAVIDASGQIPIVVLYRKMDHLGRGFSQSTLGQRAATLVDAK